MSKQSKPPKAISQALQLDGSAEAIKDYYRTWSQTYDDDVLGDHIAPWHMVDCLINWLADNRPRQKRADLSVMDVGCGTGLVAKVLLERGFKQIDGVDLSAEMIAQAEQLGLYRELTANVDINQKQTQWHQHYDVVTCCGVFTLGHVQPESLLNMLSMAKPGGLLMATTRMAYYQQTDYQQVSDQLQADGLATLVQQYKNAPYTRDSDAHYWLYQRAQN